MRRRELPSAETAVAAAATPAFVRSDAVIEAAAAVSPDLAHEAFVPSRGEPGW